MDLAGELQARLTDEMLTKFLVDNVVKDRGASNRLAAAFQTLVPGSVEAAGHPRGGGRAGRGDVQGRSAVRERVDQLDRKC